jgi:hypothetical protein
VTFDIYRLQDDDLIEAERTASGDWVRVTAAPGPDPGKGRAASAPGAAVRAALPGRRRGP